MGTGIQEPKVGDISNSFQGHTGSFGASQITELHILHGQKMKND